MSLKDFLIECREKKVFKRLSIYVVSSWVIIQVLAVTYQPLGLSATSLTFLLIALLIGLPVYIYLIWKTQLAPLEKEKNLVTKTGRVKRSKFQKTYFSSLVIISVLAVLAVSLISNNAFGDSMGLRELAESDKIGVLQFGNNTGSVEYDIISKMSADWIIHGITENELAQVVSPEIVADYISIIKASEKTADNQTVLKNYFKPAKVIKGNFYLSGSKLIFQSSITDGDIDKTLISFSPIECAASDPLVCIESLKQKILGYLITEEKQALNLERTPPKYKAYQYLLDAKTNFAADELYLELLEKAIKEDPSYFEPKVLQVGYYYNRGAFETADSLRRLIVPNAKNDRRQLNLLNHYESLLAGNNRKIYSTAIKEYNFAPFDLQTNSTTMVVALQYVNKPQDVDSLFHKIPMTEMDLTHCTFCEFRHYVQGIAKLELKQYDEVITELTPIASEINKSYIKRPVIAAYIRKDDAVGLQNYLQKQELKSSQPDLMQAYLYAGKEWLLKANGQKASVYFSQAQQLAKAAGDSTGLAEIAYFQEDYPLAEGLLSAAYEKDPKNELLISRLAVARFKNGKETEANQLLSSLQQLAANYQYGNIDYRLAQYYAKTGDRTLALSHLLKSVAAGNSYTPQNYQNDPHFITYFNTPEFNEIVTFWH